MTWATFSLNDFNDEDYSDGDYDYDDNEDHDYVGDDRRGNEGFPFIIS